MAELLSEIMFNAGRLKQYDIVAFQIMPDHVHALVYSCDRTLERVRSRWTDWSPHPTERTFSNVRSDHQNTMRSGEIKTQFTISDLMQSIKGNFSRKIHIGNILQKRFYVRVVNNRRYLHAVIAYIKHNPTKAELPIRYFILPYRFINQKMIKELF